MIDSLIKKYEELHKISFTKYSYYLNQDRDINLSITEHFRYETNRYSEFIGALEKLKQEIYYISLTKLKTDGLNHEIINKSTKEVIDELIGKE